MVQKTRVKVMTMAPAKATPIESKTNALFKGISRTRAAKAPVQPPTNGMGRAVRITTVRSLPNRLNFSVFFLA